MLKQNATIKSLEDSVGQHLESRFSEDDSEEVQKQEENPTEPGVEEFNPEVLKRLIEQGAFILYRCRVCGALDVGDVIYPGGSYDLNLIRSHYHHLPFNQKPPIIDLVVYLSQECRKAEKGQDIGSTEDYYPILLDKCPKL